MVLRPQRARFIHVAEFQQAGDVAAIGALLQLLQARAHQLVALAARHLLRRQLRLFLALGHRFPITLRLGRLGCQLRSTKLNFLTLDDATAYAEAAFVETLIVVAFAALGAQHNIASCTEISNGHSPLNTLLIKISAPALSSAQATRSTELSAASTVVQQKATGTKERKDRRFIVFQWQLFEPILRHCRFSGQ